MKRWSHRKNQHTVVDVTGDGSKVWCCKEQQCRGTWKVRSINQGKLEVVKQNMAKVTVDTLGISELKWTGMGEFNSDDHYMYYCRQESLRRMSSHHCQQESEMQYLDAISKMTDDLSSFPRQTIQYHGNPMQYLDAISKMTDDLSSFPRQTIQYHGNPSLCPNQ